MSIVKATIKGQVIIPAPLRKKYRIKKGSKVCICEGGDNLIVLRLVPDDPIEASRGMLKGKTSLLKALIKDRREEAGSG